MAKTVEQIEQDLAALVGAIAKLQQEFEQVYRGYLTELGTTTRQQLIMASYHLCTQGYPDAFLSLSVSQREALQRSLRQVAQAAQDRLLRALDEDECWDADAEPAPDAPEESRGLILSQDEAAELRAALNEKFGLTEVEFDDDSYEDSYFDEPPENLGEDSESNREGVAAGDSGSAPYGNRPQDAPTASTQELAITDALNASPEDLLEAAAASLSRATSEAAAKAKAKGASSSNQAPSPMDSLARWQAKIERRIAAVLRDQSQAANRLLHQVNILPNQIPAPIMEVAAKAGASDSTLGPPNLLNLMIEAQGDKPDQVSITRIVAIRLRLSELEFGSPLLANWRSKLRGLNARLKQLGQEYEKKSRERAIAQAEQAWRSTWHED
ncbi:hypothetical protein [Thermoleptolyngbya sp. M55_K2018_002]|uniref:hypothetical protein n=1 Tax=Thermoleptolyngbya sp. M55_K2018_002 TaxID=2747808 RepID=UPI0019E20FB6|nr:hypothetical protein [Thermoleptolyngbya sp. M55_K2018_002]HIK41020.1 hypothetical protein [Thermoleptolyngbya sp. M55_K2018_002]